MSLRLRTGAFIEAIAASYWLIPALMTAGAVSLAALTLHLDRTVDPRVVSGLGVFYSGGGQGARSLLSTVAGSMITVAGVVFSITIVALTLAASQFGPHVLRSFMRDGGSKVVLGTFIGAFIYCLLILRTVRGEDSGAFIPNISVTTGVVLALLGIWVLIYFIHHAATTIQADTIIASIGQDLATLIERLFPQRMGLEAAHEQAPPEPPAEAVHVVRAPRSGYVQALDPNELMGLATASDLLVRLLKRPGCFVVAGDVLMAASPAARVHPALARRLSQTLLIGPRRTPVQDLEFALQQLAEIAVRALSPGINDPYTTVRCIDQLCIALCLLAERALPSPCRRDRAGRLRVIAEPVTLAQALAASLEPIRRYGAGSAAVMVRLADALGLIASRADAQDRPALRALLGRMEQQVGALAPVMDDQEQVRRHLAAATRTLDATGQGRAQP